MNQLKSPVKQLATTIIYQITESLKGKQIPNMYSINESLGFSLRITEADLNYNIQVNAAPVPDAGEGQFLISTISMFYTPPVVRNGFQFDAVPEGRIIEMQYPLYAEHEQELIDGILQIIQDDSENILCQLLD
ncbi:hypothetical protein D5W64_13310 [Salmonella enterica subsp. enterica serovar Saintpaul]|nr:hypothetical protein [Salmonella enterica subsp. enterica serovar Saintpaul]